MANQPLPTQPINRPEPKRFPMVGWYHPPQLAQTAVEVAISTIFGRHSDHRLVEAMASGDQSGDFYDYSYHCSLCDKGDEHEVCHCSLCEKGEEHEVCKPEPKRPRDSIWIDYVGDVGDGWNSTYAVAYNLAKSRPYKYTDDGAEFDTTITQRGDILIFGGDEVYPTASRETYQERLVVPYETALRHTDPPSPHVFAVPGNHDWYDSLVAFTRLFTARPWFAGWRTRQSRSYFALKLPHNWWLLGTDVQLGSDIDAPQVAYFENLAKHMKEEEKDTGMPASIILCHAEPHWIRAWQYEGVDPNYTESNLKVLEDKLGANVAVYIAGDLHHYRRHEAWNQCTQKITAGGGGAFLHPTHVGRFGKQFDKIYEKQLRQQELTADQIQKLLDELKASGRERPTDDQLEKLSNELKASGHQKMTAGQIKNLLDSQVFELKGCFPSSKESSQVTWWNLAFPFFWLMKNQSWTLGLVTAVFYLLLTFPVVLVTDDAQLQGSYSLSYLTYIAVRSVLASPVTLIVIALTVVGFWLFTDSHSRWQRFVGGSLHAIAHLTVAFLIALGSVVLVLAISSPKWIWSIPWFGDFSFALDTRKLLVILLILVGGFVAGTFIMGVYVLLSMNLFGRHGNEAFSSLGIEDWKNFLRMQIDENGNLTIYPVGIRRVPRQWKFRPGQSPEMEPDDPKATEPRLVEPPIFMQKKKGTDTGVVTRPLRSES